MAEHLLDIEAAFDFFCRHVFRDVFVFLQVFQEVFPFEPAFHGIALYPAVSLFADSALFNECVEDDRAVDEAACEVEVFHHLVRIDQELVDDAGEGLEHVIQGDRAVRQDDAFDRRMGNIAFVPEGDVFQGCLGIAADDAG